MKDVKGDDALMQEELFGPILPVVPVKDVDEAIEFVRNRCVGCVVAQHTSSYAAHRDHSLSLYIFSDDKAYKEKVMDNTQSGAAVVNDLLTHIAVDHLPFGGIGESGRECGPRLLAYILIIHILLQRAR